MIRRAALAAAIVLFAHGARADDADFESCRAAAVTAQRLHAAQRLLEEREELLRCLRPQCPGVIQAACRKWLEANDEARPSIVVVAKEAAGGDVVGASFTVDGGAARVADGTPLELDPGAHVIGASAPGHAPLETEIVVAVGVKLRTVALTWPAPESAPSPPPTTSARPLPTRVIVLGSAAAAALVTASVFGVLAWREYDDLRASHSPDRQPLPTYRVAGDVALGIGIVLAGLTVWQYLARPTVQRRAALYLGQSSW